MGQHYRSDVKDGSLGFLKAIWSAARWCQWVEPNEGAEGENKNVLFYRNRNGLGVAPAKMTASQVEMDMMKSKGMSVSVQEVDDDSE